MTRPEAFTYIDRRVVPIAVALVVRVITRLTVDASRASVNCSSFNLTSSRIVSNNKASNHKLSSISMCKNRAACTTLTTLTLMAQRPQFWPSAPQVWRPRNEPLKRWTAQNLCTSSTATSNASNNKPMEIMEDDQEGM